MSILGALSAAAHPLSWPASVWVLLATVAAYGAARLTSRPAFPSKAPRIFEAYPVLGAFRFFTARGEFMSQGREISESGQYSFYWGKHRIVGLSGEQGRKTFFDARGLDLAAGYATLFSASPEVKPEINTFEDENRFSNLIKRNLAKCLRKDAFDVSMSHLLADTRATMERLAAQPVRVADPFHDFYRLVYQLTMRMTGCVEISSDPALLDKTLSLFESIDNGSSPARIAFPWLPTPGYLKRMWAGTKMYMVISKIVDERKKNGRREDDALQMMIDQGEDIINIVSFIVAALFAGLINMGINACYVIAYLASNKEWYQKVQKEVDAAVAKHRVSKDESPLDVLERLTLEDWEADFPMVDLCLRETIRFTITGCGFRQNISGKDLPIGNTGEIIPPDAYAVYMFDDLAMNESVHPDPLRWDPGRYLPDRAEDKKLATHGYLGWGAGRHPCLGVRLAKLEMAIAAAFWVASFDFRISDKDGNPAEMPRDSIDRNQHSAAKPHKKIYVKYEPRK